MALEYVDIISPSHLQYVEAVSQTIKIWSLGQFFEFSLPYYRYLFRVQAIFMWFRALCSLYFYPLQSGLMKREEGRETYFWTKLDFWRREENKWSGIERSVCSEFCLFACSLSYIHSQSLLDSFGFLLTLSMMKKMPWFCELLLFFFRFQLKLHNISSSERVN